MDSKGLADLAALLLSTFSVITSLRASVSKDQDEKQILNQDAIWFMLFAIFFKLPYGG
jgi:hypothetical protein